MAKMRMEGLVHLGSTALALGSVLLNLCMKCLELSHTYRALSCLGQHNIIRRTHVVAGLNLKLVRQMIL